MQQDHVGQASLVALAKVRRRDHVGSNRGIRGKSLHVRVGPGNGKGALTLRINTSRRERTSSHHTSSNREGERQPRKFYRTTIFTIPLPYHPRNPAAVPAFAFCRSVCAGH